MNEAEKFDKLNRDISDWGRYQSQKMQRLVGSLTLKDKHAVYKAARLKATDPSYKPLKPSIGGWSEKEKFGPVTSVKFRFRKHGIYLEHGVGRGRPVRSAAAKPKPWLKPVLDPAIDTLAELVASNYADIAAGSIKLFIPGILDRRVKIDNGQP